MATLQRLLKNAVELVRMLMKKYNIPVLNIKQHYDWSKKNCPKNLRKNGWDEFIRKCGEPEKLYRVQVGAFAEREKCRAFTCGAARKRICRNNKITGWCVLCNRQKSNSPSSDLISVEGRFFVQHVPKYPHQ